MVLGVRGIPNVQGGVETHCEKLYPLLVARGHKVTVLGRIGAVGKAAYEFRGVRVLPTWAPATDGFEAAIHTFLGVFRAWKMRADVVHMHAIGPALFAPLARILGLKVVVTHHGPDYDRQKWGRFAKMILRWGEAVGVRCATRLIVISETIRSTVSKVHGRKDAVLIFNGVELPPEEPLEDVEVSLRTFGLSGCRYVLTVGRLVPEKRFHDLVEALGGRQDFKVVIAGDTTPATAYSQGLRKRAAELGVVMPGFVSGVALRHLFRGTSLFVLPSSHEGLPIAMLEAMSFGNDVLVSDIPANLNVGLEPQHYYPVGDVAQLRERALERLSQPRRNSFQDLVRERYNWNTIAGQTEDTYQSMFEHESLEEEGEVVRN